MSHAEPSPTTGRCDISSERLHLAVEFIALFGLVPLLLLFRTTLVPIPHLLWGAFGVCLWMLRRDRRFDRAQLWNPVDRDGATAVSRGLRDVLPLFAFAAVALAVLTRLFAPRDFLAFPRERTGAWLAVVFVYPLLSVYPQNVIYRAFLFHRYRPLFRTDRSLVLASAAAFCWAHILFKDPLALVLTGLGGLIFATTYARRRSALLCSVEHALYGCFVFTVGLGWSVYLRG